MCRMSFPFTMKITCSAMLVEWSATRSKYRTIDAAGKLLIEDPLVVRPYNHPLRAAALMISRQIRRLPVVDDDGTLVGTISRADIAAAIIQP